MKDIGPAGLSFLRLPVYEKIISVFYLRYQKAARLHPEDTARSVPSLPQFRTPSAFTVSFSGNRRPILLLSDLPGNIRPLAGKSDPRDPIPVEPSMAVFLRQDLRGRNIDAQQSGLLSLRRCFPAAGQKKRPNEERKEKVSFYFSCLPYRHRPIVYAIFDKTLFPLSVFITRSIKFSIF